MWIEPVRSKFNAVIHVMNLCCKTCVHNSIIAKFKWHVRNKRLLVKCVIKIHTFTVACDYCMNTRNCIIGWNKIFYKIPGVGQVRNLDSDRQRIIQSFTKYNFVQVFCVLRKHKIILSIVNLISLQTESKILDSNSIQIDNNVYMFTRVCVHTLVYN